MHRHKMAASYADRADLSRTPFYQWIEPYTRRAIQTFSF